MNKRDEQRPLYPLDQAFVVRIRASAAEQEQLHGRIEHVSTGREVEFGNGEGLLQFIDAMVRRS